MKKLYRIQMYDDMGCINKEIYIKMTSDEARIITAFTVVCKLTNEIRVDAIEDLEFEGLFNE